MTTSMLWKPALYALSASLFLLPVQADAQFGGLIKKAADKATKKGEEKIEDKGVQKDPETTGGRAGAKRGRMTSGLGIGSEFTADQLDRVLNALELTASARMKSDSIGRLIEPLEKQLSDLQNASGAEINAYGAKHGQWEMCRSGANREWNRTHEASNQAVADQLAAKYKNDPAAAQKFAREMGQMQQKMMTMINAGDSVGARRYYEDWMKKNGLGGALGITEAELVAKCGNLSPAPVSLSTRDALQNRIDTLRTHQRDAAEAAGEQASAASGVTPPQFYAMNERLAIWYIVAVQGKKGEHFWSDQEGALFDSRRARIEKIFRQLRV